MSKHTPGPWRCIPEQSIIVSDKYGPASVLVCWMDKQEYGKDSSEIEANASLISDAPRFKAVNVDLLVALEDLLRYNVISNTALDKTDAAANSVNRAKAAIAKARGE